MGNRAAGPEGSAARFGCARDLLRRQRAAAWLLVVAVIGLDLASKAVAQATLGPLVSAGRSSWLRLGLVVDRGATFGLGNLTDRTVHGAVTDWIHLSFYPATFNLADVALRVGVVILLVGLVAARPRKRAGSRGRRARIAMPASPEVASRASGRRP